MTGYHHSCPLCGDRYKVYGHLSRHLAHYHHVEIHRIKDIAPKPIDR